MWVLKRDRNQVAQREAINIHFDTLGVFVAFASNLFAKLLCCGFLKSVALPWIVHLGTKPCMGLMGIWWSLFTTTTNYMQAMSCKIVHGSSIRLWKVVLRWFVTLSTLRCHIRFHGTFIRSKDNKGHKVWNHSQQL